MAGHSKISRLSSGIGEQERACFIRYYKLDRWWSSLGASLTCVVAWPGAVLSERVGSMHARMHYVSRMQCAYVEKCAKGFVWSDRREELTYVKAKDCGDTYKEAQIWRARFAGLSRSSLRGCLCFSFSHRRRFLDLVAITTTHCTVHMWAWRGVAAWARATFQYHVNGTDTVGRSAGRSVVSSPDTKIFARALRPSQKIGFTLLH